MAFLEQEGGEKTFLREDRRLEAERDRDAIGRTGVDVHRPRITRDVKLRVKSAVLHFGNVDSPQRTTETDDQILAEIVGERTLALELVHLDHDRLGFRLPDPDGQKSRAPFLLEDHHVGVGGAVEAQAHDFDFDELH